MAELLALAPELLDYIGEHLGIEDMKTLRLTCRQLGGQLESNILHTISFNINQIEIDAPMTKIQALAAYPSGGASRATRHILLGSLSPKHDTSSIRPFTSIGDMVVPVPGPPLLPEVYVAEEGMRSYLFDALVSLKNVQTLTWKTEASDEAWAQTIVLDALQTWTSLVKLDVSLAHARIVLPLHLLSNLNEIVFNEHDEDKTLNAQTTVNLAKLVAQSPPGKLTNLTFNREWEKTRTTKALSLHDLFQDYPVDIPSLRLQHLGLKHSFVRLDTITIPHLRHLTSLHLSNIHEPCRQPVIHSGRKGIVNLGTVADDVLEHQIAVGSTLNQFWSELSREGIYLQEITLNNLVPGFLDYLTQYSGLKKLVISTLLFPTTAESDLSARQFFGAPLSIHSESLEELHIHAIYEGLWCFGQHNLPIISNCKALKVLDMAITSDDLTGGGAAETTRDVEDIIKIFMDTVVTLPRLRRLKIQPARLCHEQMGTRGLLHMSSVKKEIIPRLFKYRAPSPCTRLPIVSIWGDVLLPEFGGEGVGWCYREKRRLVPM